MLPKALEREVKWKASRSSGSGGQHVNKVSSKVTMTWDVCASALFDDAQKNVLLEKLQHRLNKDGCVMVECEEERSQLLNRERAVKKLAAMVRAALHTDPARIPTAVPKAIVRKRLESKRLHGEKKALRQGKNRKPDVFQDGGLF